MVYYSYHLFGCFPPIRQCKLVYRTKLSIILNFWGQMQIVWWRQWKSFHSDKVSDSWQWILELLHLVLVFDRHRKRWNLGAFHTGSRKYKILPTFKCKVVGNTTSRISWCTYRANSVSKTSSSSFFLTISCCSGEL